VHQLFIVTVIGAVRTGLRSVQPKLIQCSVSPRKLAPERLIDPCCISKSGLINAENWNAQFKRFWMHVVARSLVVAMSGSRPLRQKSWLYTHSSSSKTKYKTRRSQQAQGGKAQRILPRLRRNGGLRCAHPPTRLLGAGARHSAAAAGPRRSRSTFAIAAGPGQSSTSHSGNGSPAADSTRRSSSSPRPLGNSASAFGIS
jgi:hypothetical protein